MKKILTILLLAISTQSFAFEQGLPMGPHTVVRRFMLEGLIPAKSGNIPGMLQINDPVIPINADMKVWLSYQVCIVQTEKPELLQYNDPINSHIVVGSRLKNIVLRNDHRFNYYQQVTIKSWQGDSCFAHDWKNPIHKEHSMVNTITALNYDDVPRAVKVNVWLTGK